MQIELRDALVMGFGLVGIIWYYVCLIVIGFQTSKDQSVAGFRQFMSLSITTIGVALATFVGMLLGFRGVSDEINKGVTQVTAEVADGKAAVKQLQDVAQTAKGSTWQWWASGLYAGSIGIALFCWWYRGDNSDPAIVNLGKSLLGLVAGALSILLNLPGG
ncbi:MAG: hypothetical protein HY290_29505 [Planctomycetia bacterium]|nr:hypothetical protein [Planctomycetia bacterium]